jgi:acetolactate synthase-1/2/3 large subunit
MSVNEMTGGEAIARMIMAFEGGPMFGMGGFQLLPFYDAARRLGLKHYLINDERAGVFAADAYAKVSGKVGLVDATLGPGATNLVTGLLEALNAGTPMVALVGDTHRDHSWKNMTQESRQMDILRPACKEIIRIESVQRIPELMRRAFAVATTGRPGPVVVDVPEDVCHGTFGFGERDFEVNPAHRRAPALRCRPDADGVARAAELIAGAKRPLILAGGGVHLSGASGALTAFAAALNIPVAHTMTGKGAIAWIDPLSAGLFGRYDRIANQLIEESDLLVVIGCKLGEIATKRFTVPGPGKRVIHLDILAEEFGRTLEPELMLWGDARSGLEDLQGSLANHAASIRQRLTPYAAEIPLRMAKWRQDVSERLHSDEVPVSMARLLTEINRLLPADGYLVADGGFAAHWSGLLFDTRQAGRHFVPDRGFASIGYGLPGAMGVAMAAPGKTKAGAREVTAMEPSSAFEVLKRNLADDADRVVFLNKAGHEIPADQEFDFVVSIGVIHHIPDPGPVIAASLRALRPGGKMVVWLYGREGSGLIVQGIRALRAVTVQLPHFMVAAIAHLLALALDLYVFACRHIGGLPLGDYVNNVVGRFSRSKRYLVVYDQLKPAYAKYYREAEARKLLESNGFADVRLFFRHGYSWTVIGTRPAKLS